MATNGDNTTKNLAVGSARSALENSGKQFSSDIVSLQDEQVNGP